MFNLSKQVNHLGAEEPGLRHFNDSERLQPEDDRVPEVVHHAEVLHVGVANPNQMQLFDLWVEHKSFIKRF